MLPVVYVETSFFGLLAARPFRDPLLAERQRATARWWNERREEYRLVVSEIVHLECSAGDAVAAQERLALLQGIENWRLSSTAERVAAALIQGMGLPAKAYMDALHVGIAAAGGADHLLTWNLKHLANASVQGRMRMICSGQGLVMPDIVTPDLLLGDLE